MNTSTLRALAVTSLIASLGSLNLIAQGPIRFTIPFDFTVEKKSFAAGEYLVAQLPANFIQIRSNDGKSTMIVGAYPGEPGKKPGVATMTFHRYGEQYFLSSVSGESRGWGVRTSAAEKELIARAASPPRLDVVASVK